MGTLELTERNSKTKESWLGVDKVQLGAQGTGSHAGQLFALRPFSKDEGFLGENHKVRWWIYCFMGKKGSRVAASKNLGIRWESLKKKKGFIFILCA